MFSFFKAIGKLQNGEWTFVMVKEYSHEKVEHMFARGSHKTMEFWAKWISYLGKMSDSRILRAQAKFATFHRFKVSSNVLFELPMQQKLCI